MANLVSIPFNLMLASSVKFSSYRQEVNRVLQNTDRNLPWTVKIKHLNDLSWHMKASGYNSGFRVRVLQGGISGYLKTLAKCVDEGKLLHRSKKQ